MVKRALKKSLGVGIGTTIGVCILPRLLFKNTLGDTLPPLWLQTVLCLAVSLAAAFALNMLIEIAKAKRGSKPTGSNGDK
ncbi:MAG: hypothetical protein GX061_00430 [Eubacteriaceae bacterium]|nr:hypothetical protein [Eubacteriaceae bacterium]